MSAPLDAIRLLLIGFGRKESKFGSYVGKLGTGLKPIEPLNPIGSVTTSSPSGKLNSFLGTGIAKQFCY